MLNKLAYRNVKRTSKDYFIYVITITIIVALMFSFISMTYSDTIRNANRYVANYLSLIFMFTVIVVVIVAWLVNYMARFMLDKRSKEFGIYMLLGMDNKTITGLFVRENIIMGAISLVLGIALGSIIFQGITLLVVKLFGSTYNMKLSININAVIVTFIFFGIIQLLAMFRSRRYLKKIRIHDLIYADKKNEEISNTNTIISIIFFVASCVAAVIMINDDSVVKMFTGAVAFVYLFYISALGVAMWIYSLLKYGKFRGMTAFMFRQITSKINAMRFSTANLAVLLTLSLICCNGAIMLSSINSEISSYIPFDICVTIDEVEFDYSKIQNTIEQDCGIISMLEYKIYKSDSNTLTQILIDNNVHGGYSNYDALMKISDYNALREMIGFDSVSLEDTEYIIHTFASTEKYYNSFKTSNPSIKIWGENFKCVSINNEEFALNGQNGAGVVIIIDDNYFENIPVYFSQFSCMTREDTSDELYQKLIAMVPMTSESWNYSVRANENTIDHGTGIDRFYYVVDHVVVRNGGGCFELIAGFVTIISSIAYIAFVLICVALTIQAVQLLNGSTQNRQRYKIIGFLGITKKKIRKLAFWQLLLLFIYPAIIPLVVSFVGSWKLNEMFINGTQLDLPTSFYFILTILLFLVVYAIYFITTYVSYLYNISDERIR